MGNSGMPLLADDTGIGMITFYSVDMLCGILGRLGGWATADDAEFLKYNTRFAALGSLGTILPAPSILAT
jgi:hypothetical protein